MELDVDVRRLARSGKKIEAIQLLRERTRLDLKQAKDLVESAIRASDPQADAEAARVSDRSAQIRAKAKSVADPTAFGRKEIAELPNILWDTEELLDIVQGTYNNGTGILVATSRRLIFVDKGFLWGLKVEDFPLDKISSIQYETGLLFASVTIFTSGNKAIIKNVAKDRARTFAEAVRARIAAAHEHSAAPSTTSPAGTHATAPMSQSLDDLERLVALREKGILTEEEFQAKKRQLLGL